MSDRWIKWWWDDFSLDVCGWWFFDFWIYSFIVWYSNTCIRWSSVKRYSWVKLDIDDICLHFMLLILIHSDQNFVLLSCSLSDLILLMLCEVRTQTVLLSSFICMCILCPLEYLWATEYACHYVFSFNIRFPDLCLIWDLVISYIKMFENLR